MPIDFTNIKTTRGRSYNPKRISQINDSLQYLPPVQRAVVLGSIIEESGGDPLAKSANDTYQGLLQWGKDRYRITSNNPEEELKRQLDTLKATIDRTNDGYSWTHGGEGSGYRTLQEAHDAFRNQRSSLPTAYRGFSYGYVRPLGKEDSYNNRLAVSQQVYDRILEGEDLEPKSVEETWMRAKPPLVSDEFWKGNTDFSKLPQEKFVPSISKYRLKNTTEEPKSWNDLSITERAEIMGVGLKNGLTNMDEIKKAYGYYAEGGPIENWTMEDEAKYNEWRESLPVKLRTETYDYNLRDAYRAGLEPQWNEEDQSYHLGSRNPVTGKILKTTYHPTFSKAIYTDMEQGYYPVADDKGNIYTRALPIVEKLQQKRIFDRGGYKPSQEVKDRIARYEGKAMTGAIDPLSGKYHKNNSFEAEASGFYKALPESIREQVLANPELSDNLYSYSYNVGAGNFKSRVVPALERYYAGEGTAQDIADSMWASGDAKLRGLQRRRAEEKTGVLNALSNIPDAPQNEYDLPAFMPSNPEAFFAPLSSYEQPVVMAEPESPLVEAADEYSAAALAAKERQEKLNALSYLLGMTNNTGQNNSAIAALSMLNRNSQI